MRGEIETENIVLCGYFLDIIDVSSLLDATSIDVDDQGPIKFSLWISFAEIYNEYIYDLLEPISMNKETRRRTALKVGDDRKGNPYVKGIKC
jgi:kinesin family protein 20